MAGCGLTQRGFLRKEPHMLALTRRIGESILIADGTIEIKVLSVSKRNGEVGAVCLGF